MPLLVLLNGPPACGKSTLARRWAANRSLALNLDIDVVRAQLGGWLDQPTNAGHAARALALAMAHTHLCAGRDVIIPQFLGRLDFVTQLEAAATEAEATFVEVGLFIARSDAIEAFEARSNAPTDPTHHDAAALVAMTDDADPVGAMFDAFQALADQRPALRRVDVVRGDVDATFAALMRAVG